jgi:co-chaperonin GroES (HSP10)
MDKHLFEAHKVNKVIPLHDSVIVSEMNFEERRTSSGIVIVSDDGKNSGIRPRWGKVYAIGAEQTDVHIGQYVLVAHGRWTRGIKIEDEHGVHVIRRIDTNDILAVSDEPVVDDTMGDKTI